MSKSYFFKLKKKQKFDKNKNTVASSFPYSPSLFLLFNSCRQIETLNPFFLKREENENPFYFSFDSNTKGNLSETPLEWMDE